MVGPATATSSPGIDQRPVYLGKLQGSEFDGSLGTATGYFRGYELLSISDYYNFDPKPWGAEGRGKGFRGRRIEAAVRAVGTIADANCNSPPGFTITGK